MPIHGYVAHVDTSHPLSVYGSDAPAIEQLMLENLEWKNNIHPRLNYTEAEVIWAVRKEMARKVEDVLARRLRVLFLDAQAGIEVAPKVAELMAQELNYDSTWKEKQVQAFTELAEGYLLS